MATPKLRFKEFDGDWKAEKLSQVANLTSSKRVHLSDYVSEGIPFFRGKEITELKSGIFPEDILYITKKQYEDFKEKFGAPQNNEILMTAVGTLANTYLINADFEFYFKDGNLIWFKNINADPKFLMILLDAKKNDVLASAIGSTQKALTIANLNKLIFNFPSKEEQTKIAFFLSVVDEKISQLTQKHELLSQYRQGMMQKLFSQQIRFKADDGSEFGEWEDLKFRDVITIKYGKDHKALNEGSIPVLGTGGIIRCVDSYLYDGESILIGRKGTIDKPQFITGKFWTVDTLFYTEIGERLIPKFAYQQLLLVNWLNLNEATGVPSLNTTSIGNIDIKVPCLEEQTKIAHFLSSIDQKIEVVAQQIEQTKTWKKGLLQQMFV